LERIRKHKELDDLIEVIEEYNEGKK